MERKIVRFSDVEMRVAGHEDMTAEGYALKFDKITQIGCGRFGFREKISPRAFDGTRMDDTVLTFNHDLNSILAGVRNRSLELVNDGVGIKVIARIIDAPIGQYVYRLIKDGLITRMSFAAGILEAVWTESEVRDELDLREITAFDRLYDVSAVTFPAYEDTIITARGTAPVVDADAEGHFEAQRRAKHRELTKELNKIRRQTWKS